MQAQFEQSSSARRRVSPMSMILGDVLSIEASFVLFVFAGRYKSLPEFRGIPVDVTLLFLVLTFGLVAWGIFSGRLKPMAANLPNVLMMAFCGLGILSVFWSSFEPRNIDKAWRFVLVGISSFFLVAILAQDPERRARLIRLIVGFSVVLLTYYAIHRWIIGLDERALYHTGRVQGNNYLEYAAHAVILFFAGLALAIYGPGKWPLAGMGMAVLALFLLVAVGARGPMVVALLGVPMLCVGLFLRRKRFGRGVKRMVVLVTVLVAMAWGGYIALVSFKGATEASAQLYTLQRFERQLSNENTSSMDSREGARDLAYRRWLDRPLLGWGMGEFRLHHSVEYPHNLALEILMEMGLAGGLLFFPVLYMGVTGCLRAARDEESGWSEATIALLFLTDLLSHLTVQGYLAEDRIFFAFMALSLSLHAARGRRPAARVVREAQVMPPVPPNAGARQLRTGGA